jgi:hypothetical protein
VTMMIIISQKMILIKLKIITFWDVTSCTPADIHRRFCFRRTYCFHFLGWSQGTNQPTSKKNKKQKRTAQNNVLLLALQIAESFQIPAGHILPQFHKPFNSLNLKFSL